MRQIRIIEHISLDGVIQAPGGPGEDGDYAHGGWTVPLADPAIGERIIAAHGERFDLLLGRRTYDIWASFLGTGKRFFSEGAEARELALVSTKSAASGVLLNRYRPVGRLRTGSFR